MSSVARVDYDREARHYQAGRGVPIESLEPWREHIANLLPPDGRPLLDIGAGTAIWTRAFSVWFEVEVVAVEPSGAMRLVGTEVGLPAKGRYVAARAENLPFGTATCGAAWLSTVLHHLSDLNACATELRRVLVEGAPVMIRNSFPGRLDEVELFRHFPAAAAVAARWPTLEQTVSTFAAAGFAESSITRVREGRWWDLGGVRDFAVTMRHTDSALAPITDAEFAEGLANIDAAMAKGQSPRPTGVDLVVVV
jgi:SAM-dependent methyltransferase